MDSREKGLKMLDDWLRSIPALTILHLVLGQSHVASPFQISPLRGFNTAPSTTRHDLNLILNSYNSISLTTKTNTRTIITSSRSKIRKHNENHSNTRLRGSHGGVSGGRRAAYGHANRLSPLPTCNTSSSTSPSKFLISLLIFPPTNLQRHSHKP